VTLNGAGVYIFRSSGGALTTGANSQINLNGACANNVFWAPVGATTLGATSTFVGNILDAAGIAIGLNANLTGRALAFGGTVSTNANTITVPSDCAAVTTHLTLQKTWVNARVGETATVTSTGFTNNATSGLSTSTGNNTTTGSSVVVSAGEVGTISETLSNSANYTSALTCTGTSGLSGTTLTVGATDTAIVCTETNTRKPATLTLVKTWVNARVGETATVTSTGFTNNATSGLSTSTGNNTTTGSPVAVFAGEVGPIGEALSNSGNYTSALACTGTSGLSSGTLTVGATDTAIVCTETNTRKPATLTLVKTWVNALVGETATVTSTGFTNNATSGLSTSTGNNTTPGSPVAVFAGEVGTISEALSNSGNYTATLACTGNANVLAGNSLTVNAADTAIVCTETNTHVPVAVTAIPTLSEWAMIVLAAFMAITGFVAMRRRVR
jgi:hypothetical protein